MSRVVDIDLTALAADPFYFSSIPEINITTPAISLLAYHPEFYDLLTHETSARKVWDLPWQAFHEAGVYSGWDNSLYITSNYQKWDDTINITVVSLNSKDYPFYSTHFAGLAKGNGGTNFYPPGADRNGPPPLQVYCDEGDLQNYSQLIAVDPNTNSSQPLLTTYLGRNFSSLNDVRQHPITGDLWFTDADYGYFQHFRTKPTQPKQVYRFEPNSGVVHVVADGFVQSNGIEFSPDLKLLYVTDSGSQQFEPILTEPSTIYVYDVVENKKLANRRTFAFTDSGFPDGIHCDTNGNVWASAGDGVHVWNPDGVLLGKFFIGEMSNNFAFAPGKLFIFSNHRLWVVENIRAQGREICQDFGVGCRFTYRAQPSPGLAWARKPALKSC